MSAALLDASAVSDLPQSDRPARRCRPKPRSLPLRLCEAMKSYFADTARISHVFLKNGNDP